jgi:GT2 family glycosyltransferase
MFLDCDTILAKGTLPALIRRLERDPHTVVVFNVLNIMDIVMADLAHLSQDKLLDETLTRNAIYERIGVGCCVVPVQAFNDVRGFDETYTGWGSEDNDLLIRLAHIGVHIAIAHDLPPLFHQFHERSPTADKEMRVNIQKLMTSDPGRVVNPNGWGAYIK